MKDEIIQKDILQTIRKNGGEISVGALGASLGSKMLSGQKSGVDNYKHNLQLLLDTGHVKDNGRGLGITSSVRLTDSGEDRLNSLTKEEIVQKFVIIQQQIDKIIDLDRKSLLERKELHEFKGKIKEEIKIFINQTDDETQRHYKKITSGYTNMPKPGFTNPGEAEKDLKDVMDFIEQSVSRTSGKDFKSQIYVRAGRPFDGREHLQNLFNTAKKEIFIVDSYINYSVLSMIAPIVENKTEFTLKFLIGDGSKKKFDAFTGGLPDFIAQYPLVKVECRLYDKLHARNIIIDNEKLHIIDSSLDRIGGKGDFTVLVSDEKAKADRMIDIQNFWNTATIVQLKKQSE